MVWKIKLRDKSKQIFILIIYKLKSKDTKPMAWCIEHPVKQKMVHNEAGVTKMLQQWYKNNVISNNNVSWLGYAKLTN